MKKPVSFILAIMIIAVMLTGCGSKPASDSGAASPAPSAAQTVEGGNEAAYVTADGKCGCGCGLDVSGYSAHIQELICNAHVNNETLNVYGSCDESYVNAVAYHFQELFNIPSTSIRYATGEMFSRTEEEKANPQADVWFGGSTDYYIKASEAGLLSPYDPENAKNLVSDQFIDPNHEWFGIYAGVLGLMVNVEQVEDLGLTVPTSWAELTDAHWAGELAIANPQTSATATNFLATMHYVYGYPDNFDESGYNAFMEAFDKNVTQYTKSGSGPSKMVGPGEITVGVAFLHDGVAQIANGYDNIQLIVPSEGSGFEIGACGIVKNEANPNASKLFVEYCLTGECVNLGKNNASYQILCISKDAGAEQPEELVQWGIDDLSKVNLVDYDVEDVAPQLSDWTEQWLSIIAADDRLKTE